MEGRSRHLEWRLEVRRQRLSDNSESESDKLITNTGIEDEVRESVVDQQVSLPMYLARYKVYRRSAV